MDLRNGDCLELMKDLEKDSVDLLFADLPYGQTSCKWDCLIDLDLFWKEANRVCKPDTPMVFTCSVKFGNSLINSNPKNFRYDLIWVKSATTGFLNSKKMPLKKHEMVYVFYRKLPKVYTENIALHHTHKFLNSKNGMKGQDDSVIKEENVKIVERTDGGCDSMYGKETGKVFIYDEKGKLRNSEPRYEPPLPNSVIKEEDNVKFLNKIETKIIKDKHKKNNAYNTEKRKKPLKDYGSLDGKPCYEPPLPNSVIKEEYCQNNTLYGGGKSFKISKNKKDHQQKYDPPLPNSVIKEDTGVYNKCDHASSKKLVRDTKKYKNESELYGEIDRPDFMRKKGESMYEPQLPNTILEMKSEKGKHATQKPVSLMEWILKYYSREGSVVLDPTMGSGSMGVACRNINRSFIGIEKDENIYQVAKKRCEL